ncbi:MAG: hypothetical protein AYK23_00385 [Candidatus Proteinoplasmatales archaeon SG8-5]|nr:MAG: hypothetical protein AYK23_00385 [Candidatus Proteinoplasmatales archaeon SG8-5]
MRLQDEVVLDGSVGEGGGQVLRSGLAFAAITGKKLAIENIRANRPKPGLANQHLSGLRAIAKISNADVTGGDLGSTRLSFHPDQIKHGDHEFAVGTAGAVTLVLQTILPALASVTGESRISISGGTDVKWAPPVDYYRLVLFPMLSKMGVDCAIDVKLRGYYPKGGGLIEAVIRSQGTIGPLPESYEDIEGISGIINITGLPIHIAERIEREVMNGIQTKVPCDADIRIEQGAKGPSQGVGVVLAAGGGDRVIGSNSLGERGKTAEKVGKEAVQGLMADINARADLDVHAADQILPFMALAPKGGRFTTRSLSNHAMTNIDVIERFLGKTFEVDGTRVERL